MLTLSVKKFFLISNLNLPRCNLRPFPLVLSLVTWEKRPTPVSLQPRLLQTKQLQFSQPILSRLVLQLHHQPHCSSLDRLQQLNVLLVAMGPKLNTVFECGLTSAEYRGTIISLLLLATLLS